MNSLVRFERTVKTVAAVVIISVLVVVSACGGPYFLTRSAAKYLIEDSDEFKNKTKFYFRDREIVVFSNPAGAALLRKYQDRGMVKQHGATYEAIIGEPHVVVTGILKDGNKASVEFTWTFRNVNELGSALLSEPRAAHLPDYVETFPGKPKADTESIKAIASFLDYDDGWRLVDIKFEDKLLFSPPGN